MTIDQFNEKYQISALVEATQHVTLTSLKIDEQPLAYGAIDEIINTTNVAIYERETNEEVLLIESDDESYIIDKIFLAFNIVDSNQ